MTFAADIPRSSSPLRGGHRAVARVAPIALAAVVVYGVFIRLAHPQHALYWADEVWTALMSTGHTVDDVIRFTRHDGRRSAFDFVTFERPGPLSAFGRFLSADPHTSPLFYSLCGLAIQATGDPVFGTRLLVALVGCIAVVAVHPLSYELFRRKTTAWCATAIAAVSPMQLYMSYEARPYVLWLASSIAATLALLRAHKSPVRRGWLVYAGACTLMVYSHLYAVFVVAAHAVYVAASPATSRDIWRRFEAALLGVGIAAIPWGACMVAHHDQVRLLTAWLAVPVPLAASLDGASAGLVWQFATYSSLPTSAHAIQVCVLGTLAMTTIAVVFLWRSAPREVAALVTALIVTLPLVLLLEDLLGGGRRFGVARYYVASCVGLTLATSWLGVEQAQRAVCQTGLRKLVAGGLSAAVATLVLSAVVGSWAMWRARIPDGKPDGFLVPVIDEISRVESPVLLNPGLVTLPLVLASNGLPPQTLIIDMREPGLAAQAAQVEAALQTHDVFLLRAAPDHLQFEPRRPEAGRIEQRLASAFRLVGAGESCCLLRVLPRELQSRK